MGFGHSHSQKKKKNLARRVRSASKAAQHDLAHAEGEDHHEALGHEWMPGKHHHAERGEPYPDLPSSHHPQPRHPEGYPWAPVDHPDYGDAGQMPPGHPYLEVFDPAVRQGGVGEISRKGTRLQRLEGGGRSLPCARSRSRAVGEGPDYFHARVRQAFAFRWDQHGLQNALPRRLEQGFAIRCDAAILGVPFDIGTTYRSGTRFGPQGIRRISALYGTYNYELGVDLRESLKLCGVGDVFTIANIEKGFDQISKAVAHLRSNCVFPIMLGGDHSIGYPDVRGIASLPKTLGEAVDAFEADPFIERVLGAGLKQEFITCKRAEWEEYHQSISQWEIDRYARLY